MDSNSPLRDGSSDEDDPMCCHCKGCGPGEIDGRTECTACTLWHDSAGSGRQTGSAAGRRWAAGIAGEWIEGCGQGAAEDLS